MISSTETISLAASPRFLMVPRIGTGYSAEHIPRGQESIGVDISTKMMVQATPKVAHLSNVRYVEVDLLGFFAKLHSFDALVSSYPIYHLTGPKKENALRQSINHYCWGAVSPLVIVYLSMWSRMVQN